MRALALLLLTACSSSTPPRPAAPDEAPAEPRTLAVDALGTEARVRVTPTVDLIPANGLTFRIHTEHPMTLGGHDLAVYRVQGEQAVEVPEAVTEWFWDEARRTVRVTPTGLQKGAPYLLVVEGLVTDDGQAYDRFAKPFRTLGPDTTPPDVAGLKVWGDPQPGSLAPLSFEVPEPVRHDAVHKLTALAGARAWPGTWALSEDQRTLTFTPSEPWPEALVTVSIMAGIRDLGGNELVNRPQDLLVPRVKGPAGG